MISSYGIRDDVTLTLTSSLLVIKVFSDESISEALLYWTLLGVLGVSGVASMDSMGTANTLFYR